MKITADLVEKAKNGNSFAWTQLYSETYPVAFGVAVQLVKNKDIAEDIIQDSYITAFTKLDTLQDAEKFQHWFNRIVANNCKNYLVKKKPDLFSQHSTYTEDGEEMEFDVVDDRTEYQPDNAVISDEIKQLFYDMVAKLPEEQRTCALMFWVQELTIPEIADILGVSQNTVKSRIHYAKKKMTAEAEEMKKKGISVFSFTGFALIPFLRWLFKSGSGITASPEKAESALKIAKSIGSISKSANTAKAVAETAKTVSKVGGAAKTITTAGAGAITKGIATKIIAGVLAASIGIGGITYAVKNKTEDVVNDNQTTLTEEQPTKDKAEETLSVPTYNWEKLAVRKTIATNHFTNFVITENERVIYTTPQDEIVLEFDKGTLSDDVRDFVSVAVSDNHIVVLEKDGTLVSTIIPTQIFKENNCGQTEIESWEDIVAIDVGDFHTLGLKSDGTVVATLFTKNLAYDNEEGYFEVDHGQCNVEDWSNIIAISTSNGYSLGLKDDGTVISTSYGDVIGLEEVKGWKDIVAIEAGTYGAIGVKSDGTVVVTGYDEWKETIQSWTDIVDVSDGGWHHVVGLKSDGTVVAVGNNFNNECNVESWSDIVQIATGPCHTIGLKSDGTMVVAFKSSYGAPVEADHGQANVQNLKVKILK